MSAMLGLIALVAISSHLAPHLTRRDIFFGVTVSRSFREGPTARKVSRLYAVEIWLLAMAAAAIVATSPKPFVSGGMLLGQTIGASVAFVRAWSSVRPHAVLPTTIREAAIGPRDGLPGGLIGQLGPFLILLATTAYVALNWDHAPLGFQRIGTLRARLMAGRRRLSLASFVGLRLASSRARCFCSPRTLF